MLLTRVISWLADKLISAEREMSSTTVTLQPTSAVPPPDAPPPAKRGPASRGTPGGPSARSRDYGARADDGSDGSDDDDWRKARAARKTTKA